MSCEFQWEGQCPQRTWAMCLLLHLNLGTVGVTAHAHRSGIPSGFCCLRIFVYLSKNTTSVSTKEWYREKNSWSSWLPSAQGLGYPWTVFRPSPSFCSSIHSLMRNPISSCLAQCFVSFSYSYFCFTVASMLSSLNPSNNHNHISSTCLCSKNCRWFFGALCWYVAFCCCRAAPVVAPFRLRS